MPFLQFNNEIDWIKKDHEEIPLKDGIRMPPPKPKPSLPNSEIDWINKNHEEIHCKDGIRMPFLQRNLLDNPIKKREFSSHIK